MKHEFLTQVLLMQNPNFCTGGSKLKVTYSYLRVHFLFEIFLLSGRMFNLKCDGVLNWVAYPVYLKNV